MPGIVPQRGIVPLRPLDLGAILGGAFGYVRANPLVTLGISAIVLVVVQTLQVVGQIYLFSGIPSTLAVANPLDFAARSAGISVATGLVTAVGFAVLAAILIVVLSRAVVGHTTSLTEAWAAARPRVPGLIGMSLLVALIILAMVFVGVLPIILIGVAAESVAGAGLAALIFVPLMVAAIIYVAVSLTMAAPAYVLEDIGVVAALSRSRALVQGTWWRTFGILIVAALISIVIAVAVSLPFSLLGGGVSVLTGPGLGSPAGFVAPAAPALIIGAIGSIIAGTLTAPFTTGVNALLYIDQRIRRERFDIDLARSAAGGTTTPNP